jgi:hypothetical protein
MARKKVDLKAAKAARQKKLAIGGAVLLVALLVFQVPRTLKMLQGPTPKHQSAAATTTATTTTAASSAAAPSAPVTGTPTSAPVLTAQLAPPAREGQLEVLSATFKSKDPFRQLIDETEAPSETSGTTTKKPEAKLKVAADTKTKPAAKPAPVATQAFTAPTAPKVKKITLPMLSATISVNGVREGVDLKADFPTDSPLFHLVSLTKRTAKISVAGGSLASGAPTLTLRRGKPLTLVNTADGTRYRLVLVALSTAAAVQPAQTSSDSSNTGTTTPSTTTPTTTTPTIGG